MNRRRFLAIALSALAAPTAARGHTPYGQWVVYRRKHLLIGAHRADPDTYRLAKVMAGILARDLPQSRSRVARARDAARLASLLGTDQLDVAVLRHRDALAMAAGTGRFLPYGPIAITQLASAGDHLLVAHRRLADRHAWLVAATLDRAGAVDRPGPAAESALGWHPGGRIYLDGGPEPP